MYVLKPGKKEDPVTRWNLPDRIFFGHGACHILAGVFLIENPLTACKPFWIVPHQHPGSHIFLSDGDIAFDYHGYSALDRLEAHHRKVWRSQYQDWTADILPVDFDLLDESELNRRNMRGPEQYLHNPVARAQRYVRRIDHAAASSKARTISMSLRLN